MLGRIGGIWSDGDEIFVLDVQAPALRVYDWDGQHVRDIGRSGEGPGEMASPWFLGGDDKGRLFVFNQGTNRVEIFTRAGEYLSSWALGSTFCCAYPMVVGQDGERVHVHVIDREGRFDPMAQVLQAHGPAGPVGDVLGPPDLDVPSIAFRLGDRMIDPPWAPQVTWTLAPSGDVITAASHQYRFEIRSPDGTTTVVRRVVDPVEVLPDEADWTRRYWIAVHRRGTPGWIWDGSEIPDVKPYVTRFLVAASSEIWAVRPGPGRRLPTCDPNADVDDPSAFQAAACWRDTEIVDVFDRDGRFLGELEVPDEVNLRFAFPWVSGDTVIANVYDEDGVIRVVRYRIVYPGEADTS